MHLVPVAGGSTYRSSASMRARDSTRASVHAGWITRHGSTAMPGRPAAGLTTKTQSTVRKSYIPIA